MKTAKTKRWDPRRVPETMQPAVPCDFCGEIRPTVFSQQGPKRLAVVCVECVRKAARVLSAKDATIRRQIQTWKRRRFA